MAATGPGRRSPPLVPDRCPGQRAPVLAVRAVFLLESLVLDPLGVALPRIAGDRVEGLGDGRHFRKDIKDTRRRAELRAYYVYLDEIRPRSEATIAGYIKDVSVS